MKTIKKSLSVIIALVMVLGMMSTVAFADAAHKVVVSADKTTVKAGDSIVVDVVLDNSEGVMTIGYKLAVPTAAFVLEAGINGDINDDYGVSMPACVDYDWGCEHLDLKAGQRWGEPTMNVENKIEGHAGIVFGGARNAAITTKNATADMVIGRFNITVAENAAPGEYTLYLYETETSTDGTVATAFDCNTLTITVEADGPVVPTAATLGLFTDASQNFKITENVMTSNGWTINKALAFVSGIYADADVITFGTEITCEGYDNVLDIPAANTYEAATNVKGFVAAVTSIRNDNLTKAFTAKAYADVTVDGETTRIYAENAASAVYGN